MGTVSRAVGGGTEVTAAAAVAAAVAQPTTRDTTVVAQHQRALDEVAERALTVVSQELLECGEETLRTKLRTSAS